MASYQFSDPRIQSVFDDLVEDGAFSVRYTSIEMACLIQSEAWERKKLPVLVMQLPGDVYWFQPMSVH